MTVQGELKPCPFCGGKASVREAFSVVPGKKLARFVRCDECGACTDTFLLHTGSNPKTAVKKAVKAWNKRAKEATCE